MADNVPITAGSGTSIAADDITSVWYQRVKLSLGADGTAADAGVGGGAATGALRVALATDDTVIGALAETAPASDTASSGLNGRLQRIAQRITSLIALVPASLGAKAKASALAIAFPTDQGVQSQLLIATGGTITRPANTTAYAINDAVSNNATAGSVTSQTVTLSDTNDLPIEITKAVMKSTDTGPGTAGAVFELYLFNSDPTASSGVGGGDNAAWSQKQAGFIGVLTGQFRAFSDGSIAEMVPAGISVITLPVTGAKTIYYLLKTLTAWTPSANSTTFIPTFQAVQGRS